MKILYRTIAGSRLYGLEHADSDYDYYTVVERVDKRKPLYHSQSIVDGVDTTVVDFHTWIHDCQAGVPQALEAMFSTKADVDELPEFRAAFRAGRNYDNYYGIMKRMSLTPKWDDFKHRRHVLRLGCNVSELASTNMLWPTLTPETVKFINWYAKNLDMEACYDMGLRLARHLDGVVH